jgi:hypothetical protein
VGLSLRAAPRFEKARAVAMNGENETRFSGLESRFQRLPASGLDSWGDAPGLDESAPSALNANARRVGQDSGLESHFQRLPASSTKGASFIDSLGQRPRTLIESKSPALMARFTAGPHNFRVTAVPICSSRFV